MSEPMEPVLCIYCNKPALHTLRPRQTRRGEKVLNLDILGYACSSDCLDPDERPFRFTTPSLDRENQEKIRAAWREKFGEELPAPVHPGRPVAEPREVRVPLMLTEAEASDLDTARGEQSRSEFLRSAMRRVLQERKAS